MARWSPPLDFRQTGHFLIKERNVVSRNIKPLLAAFVLGAVFTLGCGKKDEDKQPKLQGEPDPQIQGPATPGGGENKPGAATVPD